MATMKLLLILTILIALISSSHKVNADSGVSDEVQLDVSDSNFKLELQLLKSKISDLELNIEEKARELKTKDESVLRLQKVIDEKSGSISSLQGEIDSLQKKGSVDTEEQVGKAHARTLELEKQVEKLRKEIEAQIATKDALEARTSKAEKKIEKLNLKLQDLQKVNEEQKSRIRKTERALQVAEDEMVKAKLEAIAKANELTEAHGAWLPRWFATHLVSCQSFISTHWSLHGRPALDIATQKALKTKAQAQKWAEPHLETVKSRWVPAAKEQWLVFTTYMEPHVQTLSTKTVEVYESSKKTIKPHIVKAQELAEPYYEEAKKFTKPHIDRVAAVSKPHVDKARKTLKPYTKKVVRAYKKFVKSATAYHNQVQATVQETLSKHELTKPFATKDLAWFAASAVLALPVLFLPKLLLAIFSKKTTKKSARNTHTSTRRKAKRGHSDK
ncbi:hypothetical protein ACHQM5_030383 [Ranunculus cassubicifolius]